MRATKNCASTLPFSATINANSAIFQLHHGKNKPEVCFVLDQQA
jgi:hypothetical protein